MKKLNIMDEKHTLILIDGHSLAFREYYALERTNMQTSDGRFTWAVYGFFKAIFDLLKNPALNPNSIAVTFDVSHHTFRTEKYESYKSNRSAMPDTMQSQMQLIYEGLKAFNIPIYTKEGFEADDVIGTISKKACEKGYQVLILTGDQDAFQLIDKEGCIKVIMPSFTGQKEYNWQAVYDKLGIYPNQVIDYKALRGDTSDCIPGIRGIGPKTAQELLNKYYTLEEIYNHTEEIDKKSVKEKLISGKEDAFLSQYLATIVRDLDIPFDFENALVNLPDIEKVTDFLRDMQFHSFIKNINNILNSFKKDENTSVHIESSPNPETHEGQLGLFTEMVQAHINKETFKYDKKIITDSEDFINLKKELEKSNCFSFEIEAEYTNAVNFEICGIALALTDDIGYEKELVIPDKELHIKTYYIPLDHIGLEKHLKTDYVLNELKPVFENSDIKKINYNAKVQINMLRFNSITLKGCVFDSMLASYIKNPTRKHDLEVQSIENLNHAILPYAEIDTGKKSKITLKTSPAANTAEWASDRAATNIYLTKYWINNLAQGELKFLKEIELPLSSVLSDMEFNGVTVDVEYLKVLSSELTKKIAELEGKIFNIAGEGFNLNSPKQLASILFEKLNLQIEGKKKKLKNTSSTSAEVLEELAKQFDIAKYILQYRKYSKLKSTYTDALSELIEKYDNRIHTTYNQTITATGRLSSSNPNLQNIPSRTEEGRRIRKAFIPQDRKNYTIISADYSQIELRLLAHISEDSNLISAFNSGVDIHTSTAAKVFGVSIDKVTKEMRYKAKAVNFGIIYGQGKYGLASSLGIAPAQAGEFIDKYFATYPKIKEYMENTIAQAEATGYVQTIFGRRRYLASELSSSNHMIKEFAHRAAMNQPIQGTAADLIKIAMVDFQQKLNEKHLKSKLILQVHDELVVETLNSEADEIKKLLKTSMELDGMFKVPLIVEISQGQSWREE